MAEACFSRHPRLPQPQGSTPVRNNGDVSDLAGHAQEATDQLAIDYNASADSRAEGEQHEVFHTATRAHPLFAERGGVCIILKDDGRCWRSLA